MSTPASNLDPSNSFEVSRRTDPSTRRSTVSARAAPSGIGSIMTQSQPRRQEEAAAMSGTRARDSDPAVTPPLAVSPPSSPANGSPDLVATGTTTASMTAVLSPDSTHIAESVEASPDAASAYDDQDRRDAFRRHQTASPHNPPGTLEDPASACPASVDAAAPGKQIKAPASICDFLGRVVVNGTTSAADLGEGPTLPPTAAAVSDRARPTVAPNNNNTEATTDVVSDYQQGDDPSDAPPSPHAETYDRTADLTPHGEIASPPLQPQPPQPIDAILDDFV